MMWLYRKNKYTVMDIQGLSVDKWRERDKELDRVENLNQVTPELVVRLLQFIIAAQVIV